MPRAATSVATQTRARPSRSDDDPPRRRSTPGERRLVPWIVSIVLILTVGLAAAALAQVNNGSLVAIPGLRGLNVDKATDIARTDGGRRWLLSLSSRRRNRLLSPDLGRLGIRLRQLVLQPCHFFSCRELSHGPLQL